MCTLLEAVAEVLMVARPGLEELVEVVQELLPMLLTLCPEHSIQVVVVEVIKVIKAEMVL
jgi:hypothetical protein